MSMTNAMAESGVSREQVERFQTNGFLLVEDFFTHEELDHYGRFVDAAVEHRTSDDHRGMAEKNLYEQTFVQCMRLWEDHPDVAPFTFHPKLCAAIHQCMLPEPEAPAPEPEPEHLTYSCREEGR